jgi:hypothetical protein
MTTYSQTWPIFNWLRKKFKIEKPVTAPACHYNPDDITWDDWEEITKEQTKLGYFLTETLPDFINMVVDVIKKPKHVIRSWLVNGFIERSNVLQTKLPFGQYYEIDYRMLHANFETLVTFVESELAWGEFSWNNESVKYKNYTKNPFKQWRCPEAGLDKLKWEMELKYTSDYFPRVADNDLLGKPTPQAESAREKWILYHWWKNSYSEMSDPHERWHKFNDEMRKKYNESFISLCDSHRTKEEKEYGAELFKKAQIEEIRVESEIDEMLIRLMKIRRTMWT